MNIESTAQMAEDLLADTDDTIERTGLPDTGEGSYREAVDRAFDDPVGTSILIDDNDGDSYRAPAFLQYLGERFGTQQGALEARVAALARDVYGSSKVRLAALAQAVGGSRADVLDALRDFWVTAVVRDAGNLADLPNRYRVLDESTRHAQPSEFGGPDPDLKYGSVGIDVQATPSLTSHTLAPTTTTILEYPVPAGTALLNIEITDHSPVTVIPTGTFWPLIIEGEPLHMAALPILGSGDVVYEPSYFGLGPAFQESQTYPVIAAGMDKVRLVLVAADTRAEFDVEVTPVSGALTMTIDALATFGDALVVRVRPAVGGVFARQQPVSAFEVRVDGVLWSIGGAVEIGDGETLILPGASALAPGQHEVAVTYRIGSDSVTATETLDVPGSLSLLSSGVDIPVVSLSGSGLAGDPLEIGAVVASDGLPVPGASVTATVVDPAGASRAFELTDHGSQFDSAATDGAYGAEVFVTSLPGTYTVTFDAVGELGGVPFTTSRTETVTLAQAADRDADGVSDTMELRLGLDPDNPSDGAADLDLDGVGTAVELARGTEPATSDTDGGGEADGSEIAVGADPLSPTDDADLPDVTVSATAIDGRRVEIALAFAPTTGSARIYRVLDGAVTDLGLWSGDQVVVDGPLAAGTYEYRVVAESATGRRGPVAGVGSVEARDDATPPRASLAISGGTSVTKATLVQVQFNGVTGSPTQMRLAAGEAALATTPWAAYQSTTTFQLASVDGPHTIWAQVRDMAGNESIPLHQAITLDLNPPTSTAGPLPTFTLSSGVWIPFVASDDRDLALVEMWSRYRATPTSAWGAWGRRTMGESSPIFLTLGGDGYYQIATVAVDKAGNREALPAVGDVEIRVGPELINDDVGSTFQGFAQATTGLDGTVAVAWVDNRNSATIADIYFARRQDGSATWATNERVDDAAIAASSPSVAIDAAGNAYVAWVDARSGDRDIFVARRSASTGLWGASVRINDDPAGAVQDSPSIAVAPSGEVIVVWADGRGNKSHIYSARLPAGSSIWSANIRVTTEQNKAKSVPSVAIGSTGIAYVVWQQAAANKNGVWFSSLPAGGSTWAAAQQINDTSRSQGSPRIAVDTSGRLIAVYAEGTTAIWSRTRPAGSSTWAAATMVSTLTPTGQTPSLALRGSGAGYVSWTTTAGVLWGARFDEATGSWVAQAQLSATGVHARPAVAMTPSLAIVGVEVGTGTQANLRAYPATVP